ncbi:hypothetical protein GGI11_007565, partial [Coemansia sp. RSA 2049]
VLLLLLAILATTAHAGSDKTYRVRGSVIANEVLSDVSELPTRARVVVNGGEHTGFIKSDGSFAVENVKAGDSLLEISSADYAFPKVHLRISIKDDGKASIAARYVQVGSEWSESAPVLAYPLQISAAQKYEFFTPRQGFNIVAMFSNPYMLMVGASLLGIFVLPKLQANMDPEALKEVQNKS